MKREKMKVVIKIVTYSYTYITTQNKIILGFCKKKKIILG